MKKSGFTLVELLVVVAIIGILSAIILPALSSAREKGRRTKCLSNLRQISSALEMYADSWDGKYPLATGQHDWDCSHTPRGWMVEVYPFIKDKKIYKCPSFPKNIDTEFGYFMSTNAAYAHINGASFICTYRELIKYPSSFVMTGDTNFKFVEPDCDKDDYTQNCLGWVEDDTHWKPHHTEGLNVAFADNHVKWFRRYDPEKMTFRYKEYSDWAEAN